MEELPPGWFGKNHASQRGAEAATGDVLLFTDGDVTFTPDAAAYGVRYLVRERLDHLSASPRLTINGTLFQSCLIAFHLFLSARQHLWKVRDPRSRAFFGVGSCTFLRADLGQRNLSIGSPLGTPSGITCIRSRALSSVSAVRNASTFSRVSPSRRIGTSTVSRFASISA